MRMLGTRLIVRVWLFAGSLSLISLLIIGRCGVQENTYVSAKAGDAGPYIALLEQREEEHRAEVARLVDEIRGLKLQLLQYSGFQYHAEVPANSSDCGSQSRRQVEATPVTNEYEVVTFTHFTLGRVYPPELGLGRRVAEKPIGFRRRDVLQAVTAALGLLNRNTSQYSLNDFQEGLYRTVPTDGTEYEMYFRSRPAKGFTKISMVRPFAPLVTSNRGATLVKEKELIHVILPLSKRAQTLQGFLDKFVKIGLKNDRHVRLSVVYFGEDGLSEARVIMSKAAARAGHADSLRLLALNETLSRARGVRAAIERPWGGGGDELLLLCDVDVVFSARFLERCRWNSRAGSMVYYPVVFSLYNPHVVYTLQGRRLPTETDQLVVSRDTGFWRDFGFDVSCQYRSDLLRVSGFEEDSVDWGTEDVQLYRKYIRSPLKVVRSTDPGIFHIWHPKVCTGPGSSERYRSCIRSRALHEASHAQLGLLAFRDDRGPSLNPRPITSTSAAKTLSKQSSLVNHKNNGGKPAVFVER